MLVTVLPFAVVTVLAAMTGVPELPRTGDGSGAGCWRCWPRGL
jgi:hypothetical protein